MQDLHEAAIARKAKREAKKDAADTDRKRCLRRAFSSPERESQERATKKARNERQQRATAMLDISRATAMLDISRGLENVKDVPRVFKALHLCKDIRLVLEEAKYIEFRIGRKVVAIRNTSTCEGSKALAKALLEKWSAEQR